MAYKLNGTYYVACSCKVGCPCIFGEPEGDDGYCDAQMTVDISSGEIGGVDMSGVRAAMAINWPKGFVSGDGKGRMYFDPSTSQQQRDALQRAISGQEGGNLEPLGAVVSSWLDPSEASIELDTSDGRTQINVGEVGKAVVEPMHDPEGNVTKVTGLPVSFAAETVLARGNGTNWSDPDLRAFESRGYAEQADFEWSG